MERAGMADLYELLPAVHRWRDAERDGPLRDLLRLIGEQVAVVEADVRQLYESWFIETAPDWAVPYIGELIGWAPVPDAGRAGLASRRDVANTLRHRLRKGSVALLEELAADVAGWPARAAEMAWLLGWAQAANHLRLARGRTADARAVDALDRIGGPFDDHAHTVDVRRIISHRSTGRFNVPEVALFVWRLSPYPVTDSPAYLAEQAGRHCFTFSILGNDAPLFTNPDAEPDATQLAREVNVPAPIRRLAFESRAPGTPPSSARASEAYYGEDRSIVVWAPGWPTADAPQPVPARHVVPADLSQWRYRAQPGTVAVDPELGRIMFPSRQPPTRGVRVTYHHGFSAGIGGGEYERRVREPSSLARSRFDRRDIVDASTLLDRLRSAPDPLARYLVERWSSAHRALLDGGDERALLAALVTELNLALADDELFDRERFPAAPPELEAAALDRPAGTRLAVVNRRLLEHGLAGVVAVSMWRRTVRTTAELRAALTVWQDEAPRRAVIELDASDVFSTAIQLDLRAAQELTLRAAPRRRPVLWLLDRDASRPDSLDARLEPGAALTLDGLLVTGRAVRVEASSPMPPIEATAVAAGPQDDEDDCPGTRRLAVRHCTLVPGWTLHHDCEPASPQEPSLELVDLGGACVEIDHSIVGPVEVSADADALRPVCLTVADSILDATDADRLALRAQGGGIAHADLTVTRATVFGTVLTHAVTLAENTIFTGPLIAARRQCGCIRYSAIPEGSRTPRRHACTHAVATFTSRRYGRPGYAQLSHTAPAAIARGADDESELGAFHDLYQPQRTASLAARLDEHTVAGMDAGIVFVT